MAAAGARAQKPVGSAAWISTEKENCTQLVDQEMEEIEFPVRYEMEWLDEHMGEIFSNNQFNFTDAFKTPGKLRGKTPRTLRKRDPTENRVPLSEIFSSVKKNRADTKFSPSPAVQRSPTKAINSPSAPTSSTQGKSKAAGSTQPQYPELPQNINSFSQYNTDSGYHGMQDDNDDDDDDDDEVVLTQVAPESQLSTQPFDGEPITGNGEARRSSVGRRTTDASFHSAREDVRHRGDTVEPMNIDAPKQPRKEDTNAAEPAENDEPKEDAIMEDRPANEPEAASAPDGREADLPVNDAGPSPVKTTSAQRVSLQEDKEPEKNDPEKDEMALDNLDDIGSPSDADSPERPPIRKSSLSFASLPAREPLGSKPLGGSRLSRTSNLDSIKPTTAAGSNYFGRQTGHRMTQAVDENPQAEKMDVDESKPTTNEESDVDSKATKLHNKSSTQRLHEKISMLGKMQPSRPTKSIPAVANLSSAPVLYPELPAAQPEAKPEASSSKQRENTPPRSTPNADEDWIKPMSSPFQPYPSTAKATTSKPSGPPTSDAPEQPSSPLKSAATQGTTRTHVRQTSEIPRGKSATPAFSSPQRYGHQKSASVNIDNKMTTTPIGSPHRQDGPLSASKSRLQSIVRSAKGLFTSSGGVSAAARQEASSPDEPRTQPQRAHTDIERTSQRPLSAHSPLRQEGRRTRSSTEREEKRKQQEIDERKREEEVLAAEKTRQEEKLRTTQQKATRERARTESEARGPATYPTLPSSPIRATQMKSSKDPEPPAEAAPKAATQPSAPQSTRPNDRRPTKPTREPQQKPKPQPVSIRVGSALSRQMPLASSMASTSESSIPAPVPTPSTTKAASVKKKASNQSLHTASSNSSFKSSVSSQTQTQRKAQLASERKREQEEREARRKEDQRREMERKRAAQQSRAEAERRERQAEDPKKTAQMQAIEKRRLENARRLERQGSQQPETGPSHSDKTASQASQRETAGPNRPTSRLGSVLGRAINPPVPNPAKPPKRGLEEEQASHRAAAAKPGAMQPSGETKRRRTDDEENHAAMRPTMAPPIRQSNIRKEPAKKPSMYGNGQNAQAGSSIFKTGQPQRPGHPMDMAKYASGKIPFAESSNAAGPSQAHRTPGASSSKAPKQSPNYPNGENINLPEIATDSEDEDSEAEMLPVPNWAQPKELETLLRDQEGMEVDSIFGPIAPFSLEETFKADKRIKKFRDRTSSANWAGPDGLTQDEIRKDVAERQRLRMNGGWTFGM